MGAVSLERTEEKSRKLKKKRKQYKENCCK